MHHYPKLFVGVHRRGVTHARSAQPVHGVVLLLSPATQTVQDHLAQLAAVDHCFRHVDNVEQLIALLPTKGAGGR